MKKLLVLLLVSGMSFAMQPIPVPSVGGSAGNMEPKKGEWKPVQHAKLEKASAAMPSNPTRDRLIAERDKLDQQARFHRDTPSKVGKRELPKIEKRIADIDKELEGRK